MDITPPLGSPLAGYFRYRAADGMWDPLELNALAVSDGENTAVVVTADILMASEAYMTEIRGKISERLGISPDHLLLQGLHQHTSVYLGAAKNAPASPNKFYDEAYLSVLERKFGDVVQMAMDDMAEGEMYLAEKETAEPISFIRRFRMKDGSSSTNPGNLNPDIVHPIGEADNTVRLVKFVREGKKDIALVAFQTHPDVISGTKYSADWPGFVRRMTEQDIPGTHCILVNGAQGDVNHVDVTKPPVAVKGDPLLKQKKYDNSRRMGRIITDTVLKIWETAEKAESGKVSGSVKMIYIPTNTKYMDRVEEFREKKRALDAGTLKLPLDAMGEVNRVIALPEETLFRKVPVSVVGFGKVVIAGFGGEPFTRYAIETRAAHPDLFVLTACCANGGQGYLPTLEAFEEGGYEARSSRFTPSVATELPAAAIAMIDCHKKFNQ